MRKLIIITLFLSFLLNSCHSGKDQKALSEFKVTDSALQEGVLNFPEEVLWDIVYNFSSIVEIPALIKDLGVPYHNGFLEATNFTGSCNDNLRGAFLLGVLGLDLGYMSIYNRTSEASEYVAALRELTGSLLTSHLFDFAKIESLSASQSEPGLLVHDYMKGYNRMEQFLREDGRRYLITAMVTGVWMEGLYLLTRSADLYPDEYIFETIGEQKIILNDLILLLSNHQPANPLFLSLIEDLETLKAEFDKVEIVYEVDEPQAVERDGMLVIVQNQRSTVNISPEQIGSITRKMENIRNDLIL